MPDKNQIEAIITDYINRIAILENETSRSHCLSILLKDLFGTDMVLINNFLSGFEKYIKTNKNDLILLGRVDNLFGNIILELERQIPAKLTEAQGQLKQYVTILWNNELPNPLRPYLCIAGDGVRFVVYTPNIIATVQEHLSIDQVELVEVDKINFECEEAIDIYYWLDRYFLRNEIIVPTTKAIVEEFGPVSLAYSTIKKQLLDCWNENSSNSDYEVLYESWDQYLSKIYGTEVESTELFIRHTYLTLLSKLMVWMMLSQDKSYPNHELVHRIIGGHYFKEQGIGNFIEEDFFTWPVRDNTLTMTTKIIRQLVSVLKNYDLNLLSEDVLKSLYQELVDPSTRQTLGEFYTPDWLAQRIIENMMTEKPEGTVLDPACGSGTFLYLTIKFKREQLNDSPDTLEHILLSVVGVDIHPLAVIIAKTNYLLALGDLLKDRLTEIFIPVYLADTIVLPQQCIDSEGLGYIFYLESTKLLLQNALVQNNILDKAIEIAREFAEGGGVSTEGIKRHIEARGLNYSDNVVNGINHIVKILKGFIDNRRDGIWAYVLKNIFKPLLFENKFNYIVGNPPWIVYRTMDEKYRDKIKSLIIKDYTLETRGELITHLEIATLFFIRCSDLYLQTNGKISFILPKSVFNADHHHHFRRQDFRFKESQGETLEWTDLWDC